MSREDIQEIRVMATSRKSADPDGLGNGLRIVGGLVVFMWGLEVVDWMLGHPLDAYGIQPRSIEGLWHIVTAPFLHGGFGHLSANTKRHLERVYVVSRLTGHSVNETKYRGDATVTRR